MLSKTPVLILCGGLGTRLKAALPGVPKGLAAVGDKPFLQLQIELLRDQGARHFVLCVGHMAGQIRDTFGDGSSLGVKIDYSEERDQLLGTGGAVRLAGRFITPRAVVMNGDTYLAIDYPRLLSMHAIARAKSRAVLTMALATADDPSRFGSVEVDADSGRVVGFREKAAGHAGGTPWLNAGTYVVERELLDFIPEGRSVSIEREVFPVVLAADRTITAAGGPEPFFDIGTPDDWRKFAGHYESRQARRAA